MSRIAMIIIYLLSFITLVAASPAGDACRKEIITAMLRWQHACAQISRLIPLPGRRPKEDILWPVFPRMHDTEHHPGSALVLARDGCSFPQVPLVDFHRAEVTHREDPGKPRWAAG